MYRPKKRATVCPHCEADTMIDVGLNELGFCDNCERQFSMWEAPEEQIDAWIGAGYLNPQSPHAPPQYRKEP